MSNRQKYNRAFMQTLSVDEPRLALLKYQDVSEWDSVGHMSLMAALEEAFGIQLDVDDIIDFSSYDAGQAIVRKYGVTLE